MAIGGFMAGASFIGNVAQGRAEAKGYNASARGLEMQAKDKETMGRYEKWRRSIMQRQAVGEQIATYASLGVSLEGTAIENLAETVKELTYQGVMESEVNRAEVRGLKRQAKDLRDAARSAKRGGLVRGITGAVSSLASYAK